MRDQGYPQDRCNTFWGSHGCDLAFGHEGPCVCDANDPDGPCSTYERGVGVRFYMFSTGEDTYLAEPMPDYTAWGDQGDDEKSRA